MRLATRCDTVGGWRIFARLCAAGQPGLPVVLVHGLSMSSRYLVPTARRLAVDHPVYAPDLPGYGRSEHPLEALTVPQLAGALVDWTDFHRIGPAVLLGNSMGCQIVVDLAVRYPERVRKAVLIGPSIDPPGRSVLKMALRGSANMLFEPLSFWPVLLRDYLSAGVRRTMASLKYSFDYALEDTLSRVAAPALVIRGERDYLIPQRWAERVADMLPEGRLAVVPRGAHVTNFDAPDAVARLVRDFLAED